MGFFTYLIHPTILFDNNQINDPIFIDQKVYHILDKIDINYVTIDNTEKINICMTLNIYQNYEDRLLRINCIDTLHFISIQDSINKSIPESLWNKCYIKIKELLIDQNTQNIKISLNLRDSENISSQHQYLLEIDDHFN